MKLVKRGKVYDLEKYQSSADKYNLYLSGPTSIITIDNPNTKTKKELILFRDSFGSSIAPLLIENYRKITLIDFRYINEKLIEQYIKFENQDILFLYSVPPVLQAFHAPPCLIGFLLGIFYCIISI